VIEKWLVAIRDHPGRPPAVQRLVLHCLALRMNWETGAGFASTGQLAADSDAEERTVRRATSWARQAELLLQTRRGHRLGNGQVAASEWQLTQPVTGGLLTSQPVNGQISTGQQGHLNRSAAHHHQDLSSSQSSSSARGGAAAAVRAVYPDAADDEIRQIEQTLTANGARSTAAVAAKMAADGTLRLPCGPQPGDRGQTRVNAAGITVPVYGRSNACHAAAAGCDASWCTCRCHVKAVSQP
jgi:hypothetical protein